MPPVAGSGGVLTRAQGPGCEGGIIADRCPGKAKAPASLVNKGKQGPRYLAVTVGFELSQKRRRQSKIVELTRFMGAR